MYLARTGASIRDSGREDAMAEAKDTRTGTYRCPVCGHRDSAELGRGQESAVIPCSYCNTPLEVASRGPDSIRFKVQVSEQPATR